MKIFIHDTPQLLEVARSIRTPVMLAGRSGIGKTYYVYTDAIENNLIPVDLRMDGMEPQVLTGIMMPNDDLTQVVTLPLDRIPLESAVLPKGKKGWVLMLDELPNAPTDTQQAAFSLVQERMSGNKRIHPACHIVGMGNLSHEIINGIPMPDPLVNKMIQVYVDYDSKEVVSTMASNSTFYGIVLFLTQNPQYIFYGQDNYRESRTTQQFATIRSWYTVSKILKGKHRDTNAAKAAIYGLLGIPTATAFIDYMALEMTVPTFEDILANTNIPVPSSAEIGASWYVALLLSRKVNPNNVMQVLPYIDRLDTNIKVVFIGWLLKQRVMDVNVEPMKSWIDDIGAAQLIL